MDVIDALLGFVMLLLLIGAVIVFDVLWRQIRQDDHHDVF